jgi:hypothetical protein
VATRIEKKLHTHTPIFLAILKFSFGQIAKFSQKKAAHNQIK